jgi:biopolymer transport protein ExbB/TolQ
MASILTDSLYSVLGGTPVVTETVSNAAGVVSEIFLWILIFFFILGIWGALRWKENRFSHYAPTLFTSLGILGTFIGIVIGLIGFNPQSIDESIPLLLEGLKTAFITSLAGMFFAILYKLITFIPAFRNPSLSNNQDEVGAAEIHAVLNNHQQQLDRLIAAIGGDGENSLINQIKLFKVEINDNHKESKRQNEQDSELLRQHSELLTAIRQGLVGEEEGSMAGQLRLLRTDLADNIRQMRRDHELFAADLWERLTEFAEMLSKSATETVIEALKAVITDFNQNLTEQFGDNFKQLNQSVDKLLDWQENYRTQLSQMIDQYQQGVVAITATEQSIQSIEKSTQAIPVTMQGLQEIMTVNQQQIAELGRHLEAFAAIRDRAVEAYPEIRQQLDRVMTEMAQTVDSANKYHTGMIKQTESLIGQYAEQGEHLFKHFTDATQQGIEKIAQGLTQGAEEFGQKISQSANLVSNSIIQSATDFENNTNKMRESLVKIAGVLHTNSEQIKEQLTDTVSDLNNGMRALMKQLHQGNNTIVQQFDEVVQKVSNSGESIQKELLTLVAEYQGKVKQMNQTMDQHLQDAIGSMANGVNENMNLIDKAMQDEIERVMNQMGSALVSIGKQFTLDYQQLVQAMKNVIDEANNVRN